MIHWERKFSNYANRIQPSAIFSLVDMPRAEDTINLGPGEPDPSFFPAGKLSQILAEELADPEKARIALQYTVNAGMPELRKKICTYHATKAVRCDPGNVLITSGSQEAIDMVVSAFVEPGQKIAAQSPTYPGAMGIFKAHGAEVISLDEALLNPPENLALIYTTPTFSNPSGETLDLRKRQSVVALARNTDALIIEDDAYETMRYEGEVPPIIQSLDAAGTHVDDCRTLYTSTFSKSLVPGLRVGWLVGPAAAISKLTLLKQSEDMQAGTLSQVCAAHAIDFVMTEHVPVLKKKYKARRDAMLSALETYCGNQASWTLPTGGFFVWVTLPEEIDTSEMLKSAALNGVTYVPGAACSYTGGFRNCMRLSYSTNPPEKIETAVKRLAMTIDQFSRVAVA